MTPNEVYLSILTKLNANLGTDNITVDKPRVVIAYNESMIRRISDLLSRKIDESLREIQGLLVLNHNLVKENSQEDRVVFTLPENYFDISSAYAEGSKGVCKEKELFMWEIKDPNYNQVLSNVHYKPSFSFQEVPYVVNSGKLTVFKTDDFEINEVFLSYYRYPQKFDIQGYINIDNTPSANVAPELDERFIHKVIALTVEDIQRNFRDQLGHQLSKDRVVRND